MILLIFGTLSLMMVSPAWAEDTALGAIPVSEDYVLRTWEVDEGLPNNSISNLAQTPDGYLWLTTGSGLVRFDGVRFTPFPKETTPGLESNRMSPVFAARDGALWIGLERGGVSRLAGGRFETIVPLAPSGATAAWTSSFAQDADGAVWFGLWPDRRVFRWRDGVLAAFSSGEGVGPGGSANVYTDMSGKIWCTTTGGCGVFDGTRFQPVAPDGGGWPVLAPAREGGVWVFRGERLWRYQADGSAQVVSQPVDLSANVLFEDSAGDLWIGTKNEGLFRFHSGKFLRVPTSHSSISSIVEDREGNLWVGTFGGGLNRLRPCRFFLRQKQNGLHTDGVVSLCEDAEGKLWIAGRDGEPVRAMDSSNRAFVTPEGWSGGAVLALCPDPAGGIWLGTMRGLMHWRDGKFGQDSLRDALTALLVDRHGDLWAATVKNDLVCWRNGVVDHIPIQEGLVEPRALAEDAAGRLWVGTEAGLVFQRKGERFVPVPLPGEKLGGQVRFIVPDEQETVWIGEFGGGLYRWRAGQITPLPHDSGLPVDDLRSLVIGPGGDFWFGTGSGLFRVARSEIDAVMDRRRQSMRTVAYGRNEGMPNVDFNFGFKNTTTRTRNGHLWFATSRGGLEIAPQDFRVVGQLPPLLIEEVRVGRTSAPVVGVNKLVLPPQPGLLQIRYTLPALSSPEQIHFRYRLVGWGDEWILADRQRAATFAHLPPGDYRFEVAAAEADGPWLPATASIAFAVRAAWWETGWFHLGAGVFGALSLAALVRFLVRRRMRAKMRRLEQEHALERERARIARDMHDQVGANLTHIALLAGMSSTPQSRSELADSARRAVDSLDGVVWAVNPRKDTLDSLFQYLVRFAEDFLKPTSLGLRLDFPLDVPECQLPPEFRYHVLLVVKEALNNAVKYSGATEVHLSATMEPLSLGIIIADNGGGFDVEGAAGGGNGLRNLRERALALRGECRINSQPGAGTCITLIVPWPHPGPVLPPVPH
ncbi:MAG: hypothetical protein JF599_06505 [Verrucomicrobia bacterium]|nr:hypothetical protein [Verrucomicrobiota bacterium]